MGRSCHAFLPRMRVPLLDLSEQYRQLSGPIRTRIDAILASQQFILGPNVEKFENAICRFTGAAHAIGASSGTDALLAVLMALGIGRGDAVVTTAYSFFATAGCIARLGATPLFVDIEPSTYNISPQALEAFLRDECERKNDAVTVRESGATLRAIVAVHLFGLCCDMNAIHRISEEYQLDVIEDAAQAIEAEYPFHSGPRQASGSLRRRIPDYRFRPQQFHQLRNQLDLRADPIPQPVAAPAFE